MQHNPNKRVNAVLIKPITDGTVTKEPGDVVMRTTRSFAEQLIATGNWAYCNKSKLKSFLNRDKKLSRNMRALEVIDSLTGSTPKEKRFGNKVVVECPTFKHKVILGRKKTGISVDKKFKVVKHTVDKGFRVIRVNQTIYSGLKQGDKVIATKTYYSRQLIKDKDKRLEESKKLSETGDKVLVVAYSRGK